MTDELLLSLDHVKYRKPGEGRSPIGRLMLYREHVEWHDNTGSDILYVKFIQIKGQRVSPPNKSKVQLQLCLQNDDQATFVFLNPSLDKDGLVKERDLVKETLQQALIAHRAKVNQLASSNEQGSKTAELKEKERLLMQSKQLEQLYRHLVATKLITAQEFWTDYYKTTGIIEDKTGVSGAFLANIVQQEGSNGIKLNLNTEIIQAIFNTYPTVETKHLELVPHEMTETQFWSKFFQSHYFHREREVLPNPNDPFAECVRMDEVEMDKLNQDGVTRKRFDLEHLDDYIFKDFIAKPESSKGTQNGNLVRRCNYLSERILSCLKSVTSYENGDTTTKPSGFAMLNRIIEEEECRLESADLIENQEDPERQEVLIGAAHQGVNRCYPPEEAEHYKRLVLNVLDNSSDPNGDTNSTDDTSDWGMSSDDLAELRAIHEAVAELLKHFWMCFPPLSPELEAKIERMERTLRNYEAVQLSEASRNFGKENVQHCFDMISRAHTRYQAYAERKIARSQ
uniref:BSD domain-containing protein n=1 Tax=Heterorhabditis bacteriophora TaxID=37862 RepID=A0A1I7WMU0_HETBA